MTPVPATANEAARLRARAVAAWHAAWALGVAAGFGLLLTCLDHAAAPVVAALACGALPGMAGWLLKPANGNGLALLVLWAAGGAFAMALTGGVSGPLAVWAFGPILVGAALGGLWRDGATLSFAALAGVALIQASGAAAAAPTGGMALGLGLIGLSTTLAGAAGVLLIITRAQQDTAPAGTGRALVDVASPAEPSVRAPIPDTSPEAGQREAALQAQVATAEAARDDAEADGRAKMRFLANMSHELRTPLNAIMGFSDIMRARLFGELAPKYGEYADLIHESGGHLLDLINDVLDMSKIEADRYELSRQRFDVREAVNGALRILRVQADEAGIQLRGGLPPEPLEVDADRRAIKQIVLNLVSNALKFTPAGGSVAVALQAIDAATLEIIVADTGVGIAPNDLERLGRPFEQAGDADQRVRGTGLGLSLVKAFAQLHGGEMRVQSRLGEGTAVTVRLPVRVSTEAATSA